MATVKSPVSRENEPGPGSWVRDRFGGTHQRNPHGDGWGEPGAYYFGKWEAMWDARGPLVPCGRWGAPLAEPDPMEPTIDAVRTAWLAQFEFESGWERRRAERAIDDLLFEAVK